MLRHCCAAYSVQQGETRGSGLGRDCHLMHLLREFGQVFRNLSGKIEVKIAITLPEEQVARVRRAVRAGLADSVSGYITRALSEQERRESLNAIVRDLIAEYGEPRQKEITWAKRALARRNRA